MKTRRHARQVVSAALLCVCVVVVAASGEPDQKRYVAVYVAGKAPDRILWDSSFTVESLRGFGVLKPQERRITIIRDDTKIVFTPGQFGHDSRLDPFLKPNDMVLVE